MADTNYTSYKAQSLCMCEETEGSSLGVRGVEGRHKLLRGLISHFFPPFFYPPLLREVASQQKEWAEGLLCGSARWCEWRKGGRLVSCQLPVLSFWGQIEAMGPLSVVHWPVKAQRTYSSNTQALTCLQVYLRSLPVSRKRLILPPSHFRRISRVDVFQQIH